MHPRTSPTTQVLKFYTSSTKVLGKDVPTTHPIILFGIQFHILKHFLSICLGTDRERATAFDGWDGSQNFKHPHPTGLDIIGLIYINYRICSLAAINLSESYLHTVYIHVYIEKWTLLKFPGKLVIFSCHKNLEDSHHQDINQTTGPPEWSFGESQKNRYVLFLSVDILQCKTVLSDTQQMRVSRSFFIAFVTGLFVAQSLITLLGFFLCLCTWTCNSLWYTHSLAA